MDREQTIKETKEFRRDLDAVLQRIKTADHHNRERSLARTRIEEAIMWLGMDLKAINGGVSCYKHGYDPDSTEVEPTADGVKL